MKNKQQGATLIVALVILAVVTVIGVASIRGTSLNLKMVASARDRALAFEAAEATLRSAEQALATEFKDVAPANLAVALNRYKNASSCANGHCFSGEFEDGDIFSTCQLHTGGTGGTVRTVPFWQDPSLNVWETEGKHIDETINLRLSLHDSKPKGDGKYGVEAKSIDAKYIVEFMCFAVKDRSLLVTVDDKNTGDGALIYMPLFRITAVAEGIGGRATVAAQSMFKVETGS